MAVLIGPGRIGWLHKFDQSEKQRSQSGEHGMVQGNLDHPYTTNTTNEKRMVLKVV